MFIVQWFASLFRKVFGTRNDRIVKQYRRRAEEIAALEPGVRVMSDAQLRERTEELRRKIGSGEVRASDAAS